MACIGTLQDPALTQSKQQLAYPTQLKVSNVFCVLRGLPPFNRVTQGDKKLYEGVHLYESVNISDIWKG